MRERNFRVIINDSKSEEKQIKAGVPQGSILGPVLFNVYLNDIPLFSKTHTAIYADDTAVYAHSFSAIVAAKQIQIHVSMLDAFYKKWKISLNTDKTEVIVFSRKQTGNKIIQPIRIYNNNIKVKQTVKYLGVVLDPKLTYRQHIKGIQMKGYAANKNLYSLMVRGSKLSKRNKLLIYKMIIRPIILYASPVWRCTAKTNTILLQRFQNKCLRLVLNKDRYIRIKDLHEEANIEYVNEYITESAIKFYNTQLKVNRLTGDIVNNYLLRHRESRIKHKFPFVNLDLSANN